MGGGFVRYHFSTLLYVLHSGKVENCRELFELHSILGHAKCGSNGIIIDKFRYTTESWQQSTRPLDERDAKKSEDEIERERERLMAFKEDYERGKMKVMELQEERERARVRERELEEERERERQGN